jgi:hypothetical protein
MSFQSNPEGAIRDALEQIVSLKVVLAGAKPQIWRRIVVPGVFSLGALHDVIQISMGWQNYHLHCFRVNGAEYSVHYDGDIEPLGENADSVLMLELGATEPGFRFEYEYDFGDSWEHEIQVESVGRLRSDRFYPYCEKAVRACPPEDCGGIYGYSRLLRILKNPEHREYQDIAEWLGDENFDPKAVDLDAINVQLRNRFAT